MKDGVVQYEEIQQDRRVGPNESAYAELRPHEDVEDSSTNAENLGNYNEDINVI